MPYPVCSTYNCKSDPLSFTKVYEKINDSVPITYNFDMGIENPVLYFSKDIDPNLFNYVYIPDLGRNYWVTSPPTYLDGIYSVQCHVDVLETYGAAIKDLDVIIKRNAKHFNKYMQDDKYQAFQPTCERVLLWAEPNHGFSDEVSEFILCTVGDTDDPEPEQTEVIKWP